jgi:hypothetical protein
MAGTPGATISSSPAEPLLAAAPWVVVRGNHETCKRAGRAGGASSIRARCCRAATATIRPTTRPPTTASRTAYRWPPARSCWSPTRPIRRTSRCRRTIRAPGPTATITRASPSSRRRTPYNIALTHHPLLGFYPRKEADGRVTLQPGNAGILSVWGPLSPTVLPANVQVLLSGHTHLWQQVSFSTPHASQFIVGFSGTDPDDVPIPARVPPGAMPAPGAIAERISSWVGGFGFMTMEQHSPGRWQVGVHDHTGKRVNYCLVDGAKTVCDQAVVPRTP